MFLYCLAYEKFLLIHFDARALENQNTFLLKVSESFGTFELAVGDEVKLKGVLKSTYGNHNFPVSGWSAGWICGIEVSV